MYDRMGHQAFEGGMGGGAGGFGGFSAEDIFSQFGDIFGGAFGGEAVASNVNAVVQTYAM